MQISAKRKNEALDILKSYSGSNPYILMVKRDVVIKNDISAFNDFAAEYVLLNKDREPKFINKSIKVVRWWGEKKKEDWGLDFVPEILVVKTLIGETETTYNCYVKYMRNMEPVMCFIPKSAVLTNFIVDDYRQYPVDFDKYDSITTKKDPNRKLKEHQKDAVKFLLSRKKCILSDDQGLGKTMSLTVAALEGQFEHILIICPASIKTTWKKELSWYVDKKQITIIEGINGKKKAELEEFLGYPVGKSGKKVDDLKKEAKELGKWQDNKFVIVNYDILNEFYEIPETRSAANIQKAYDNSPMLQYIANTRSLVIIDEVHRLSNNKSIRYKVVQDLLKRGKPDAIYEATGTPITNRPMNFYNVLLFLNDPITSNWEEYVKRYCDGFQIPMKGEKEKWTDIFCKRYNIPNKWAMTNAQQKDCKEFIRNNARLLWVTDGFSNLDELRERVSHLYLRRLKADVPGIVGKTCHELYYDLTKSQQAEYNKLWDEYEEQRLELNPDDEVNKDLIEGGVYRRYLSNQMVPHTIELAEELLEEGRKVVIGCCYDEELYSLKEYFGDRCVVYNGKMNSKQKDAAKDKFMEDENVNVMICNIMAAGVGLSLTASNALIFNNMSFVPGDNLQFEDRIHRLSSTEDVDIYYQIFNDTQYEHMWNIVLRKSMIIDQVIKKEDEK